MYLTGPAVRRKSRIAAGTAANRLFASRILVIPAVIAMGFAIGFTWYGSRVPEPTTTAVSEEGSGKICGELRRDAEGHLTSTSTNQWP